MQLTKRDWLWLGLIVTLFLLLRSLFPKVVTVPGVPRIVTQYDTVRVIDTAWVTRLRRDTVRVNVTERVTVTVPETLYVLPAPERGITAVSVGPKVGDSTLVAGFSLTPLDSGISRRGWQVQFYTLGPVKSLVLDSVPRITFYDPPPPSCRFFCKLGHYALGASVGFGLASVLR
jgi:hypothetical protein